MTMTAQEISALRLGCQTQGYSPIPVNGKRPQFDGWQHKHAPQAAEVAAWVEQYPTCGNTGILTGRSPAIDIDIKNPEAADAVEELARDWFDGRGAILIRVGEAPKRALLCRTEKPFTKRQRVFLAPNGKTHKIEILGDGQQIVVAGIHPDTKRPYTWHGGDPWTTPRAALPEITEKDADDFIALATDMLREKFEFEIAPEEQPSGATGGEWSAPVDIDASLAAMVYQGPNGTSVNDTLKRVIPALLRRATPPDEVVSDVVTRVMAMAGRLKLGWDHDEEVRATTARVVSAFRLLQRDYDHTTGVIPDWLAAEFHNDWILALKAGAKPTISRNHHGWHIRAYSANNGTPKEEPKKPDEKVTPFTPPPPRRFRLLRYSELHPDMGDRDYLVDELLPTDGLVMIWGKFKCLKTFWVYDLMLHVARGMEYRDRAVRQGTVVYCAFEGAHGFRKRTEAQRRHYHIPADEEVPLYVMPCQVNLIKDHVGLVTDIKAQLTDGQKPVVVVLDTLNRSLVGSEGKDVDMAAYIAAASAIREAFGCLVIIVHHCGWDESRPRGHSSLPGAVDGQLAVSREGDHITVLVELLRDGPEGAEIHSLVHVIEVGADGHGKPLTSLVVMPADNQQGRPKRWPKSLSIFNRAMKKVLDIHGQPFHHDVALEPVRAVDVGAVREEFYVTYHAKGDTELQKQEARRKAFRRSLTTAQDDNLIGLRRLSEDGPEMVWFVVRPAPEDNE